MSVRANWIHLHPIRTLERGDAEVQGILGGVVQCISVHNIVFCVSVCGLWLCKQGRCSGHGHDKRH